MASSTEERDASEIKGQDSNGAPVNKYDTDVAELLAANAQNLPVAQATPIYEQLLSAFPTAPKIWKQYVEAHMAVNNDDAIKQIFSRCLLSCLYVPLWRCYIRFIRKVNESKGQEGQEETRKAFEFMLSYVGTDISSGPVWIEYLSFLKSLPALNAQEESQRMTAIRKTYQRAVVTPTHHVEQLWKDYENFENSVSRQLAKGLLSDYQPKYNSARAVYKERKKYVDEIEWNILAVPPTGSYKEEVQWTSWFRLLSFEKSNPQRIEAAISNKRVIFSYEQSLMYLYHYPDVWYDYAMWLSKNGSVDAAVKVFQRALKALPDSDVLKYAYSELEESRGGIQSAKRIYQSLVEDHDDACPLAHIQFIRFLRRTEGVEAARKYFLDYRKIPNCSYHVYIAYALMAFCLDKDPKAAHNVFEAGLKLFMHEPAYIIEYADFLSRLNDDRNIRALFERTLSTLPAEESIEVWKRFILFEQTYGDLASALKVEQRSKEALSRIDEGESSTIEGSLQDVISRYNFMDLWPCSDKDLDHLIRQEWLVKKFGKKMAKIASGSIASGFTDKDSISVANKSNTLTKFVLPDTSRMLLHNQRHFSGEPATSSFDEVLKATPPGLLSFLANLPAFEGPAPNVDVVLSICLQGETTSIQVGKSVAFQATSLSSELSGSNKLRTGKLTKDRQSAKRKVLERQDDDESSTVQSQTVPRDAFRLRQIQKSRIGTSSQTGSASYGSALSGDLSGTTG